MFTRQSIHTLIIDDPLLKQWEETDEQRRDVASWQARQQAEKRRKNRKQRRLEAARARRHHKAT